MKTLKLYHLKSTNSAFFRDAILITADLENTEVVLKDTTILKYDCYNITLVDELEFKEEHLNIIATIKAYDVKDDSQFQKDSNVFLHKYNQYKNNWDDLYFYSEEIFSNFSEFFKFCYKYLMKYHTAVVNENNNYQNEINKLNNISDILEVSLNHPYMTATDFNLI